MAGVAPPGLPPVPERPACPGSPERPACLRSPERPASAPRVGDDEGMRVVVVNECGGPDVLTVADREDVQPGPGQLLVDVAAAGVNFMDIYQREGRPPYGRDLPFVPGSEGAGTVAALGPGAEGFAVGDRVAWAGAPGCYAEQAVVPAASAVSIPDGIETTVAAAVMLQGITAHYLCHSTYPVTPGDTVVVHAAAGGVGLLLTQMVKMLGGIVIATTSSPAKADLARQAGADHVTGYEEFGSVVREVTGGAGAAAVYDGVGQATFDASLAARPPARHDGPVRRVERAGAPVRAPAPRRVRLAVHHPPHDGPLHRQPRGAGVAGR